MKKLPVCKNCGKVGHYQYQCWSKMRSKPPKARSKARVKPKTYSIPSRSKKANVAKYERQKLIKELDKYTSLICRLGASDKNGYAVCYCCGKRIPWQMGDCAHYVKRSYMDTRWYLPNVKFNCISCNRYKNGNYPAYEAHLKRDIGIDEIQKLWDKAYKRTKFQTCELAEILVEIKQKYKTLVEERKNKGWKT